MPFRIGEKLDYRVAWATFANAASIELTVPERRDLMGWGTWHFRASAHTLSPMRALIAVDDQFDSYTDAATLESRQYETYLNEMGRKQTEVFNFLAEGRLGLLICSGVRSPSTAEILSRPRTPAGRGLAADKSEFRRQFTMVTMCTTCGRGWTLRPRH